MTTLAILKARIADDILRTDLTTQIAEAISDAINYWKETRLFFNNKRTTTFATVASQSAYTSSDDADIGLIVDLDTVFINDGSSEFDLTLTQPEDMEFLLANSTATGVPGRYGYFEETIRLYPTPDAAYTVRMLGQFEVAEPASDSEANNPWMTKAFELIRATAKGLLAGHVLRDQAMQISMFGAPGVPNNDYGLAGAAVQKLLRQSAKKAATGYLTPTEF